MRLETLLPRPLDPCGGSECATLMGALIAAIHLDRRRARALGWRGVRPSGSLLPAWTCRVAGSGLVFGLVFLGEDADGGALRGTFAAYAFPLPDDPLLEVFPLEALRLAVDPGYGDRIRALSEHAETLSPFRIGTVSLRAAVDGSGLSLTLSAPARLRMAALDGVAAFYGGQRWLVEPGGWETDVPAFRLLLRPFAALSATAESLLGDPARVSLDGEAAPIPGFDAAGNIRHIPGGTGRELRLTAAFGSAGAQGRPLARLPLRHKPLEEESGLPVLHILTGFLGSGKTTFLRQWLDFLHGRERYTGVIQNEFGEIGLDAALLRGETQVEALDEGCVCCSLADSLRPGLLRLIGDMPAEQFILETTGLANPANVMEALSELRDIVQPGLVITVADALDLCHSEGDIAGIRRAQAARADVIILNKADTVEPAALEALAERLRALNRQALILPARHGAVAFAELDAFYADWADRRGTPLPSHRPALPRFGETVTHADEGFVSAALRLSAPLDEAALLTLLDSAGPGLCRAKGVVDLRLDGGVTVPATVQYAAGRLGFEPAPEGEERYLVFIGTDISLPEAPSS